MGRDHERDHQRERRSALSFRNAVELLLRPSSAPVSLLSDRWLRDERWQRHDCLGCGARFVAREGTVEPIYPFCEDCCRAPEPWLELGVAG